MPAKNMEPNNGYLIAKELRTKKMKIKKTTCTITKSDLWAVPMDDFHKDLVITQYQRLYQIIDGPVLLLAEHYAQRQVAREQLARMTLVIRDYMSKHRIAVEEGRKNPADTVESMVGDVLDASLFIHGPLGPAFASPVEETIGPETECLMHEVNSAAASKNTWGHVHKVNPDKEPYPGKIGNVEWKRVLGRSCSEHKVLHRKREPVDEEREAAWRKQFVTEEKKAPWLNLKEAFERARAGDEEGGRECRRAIERHWPHGEKSK